MHTDHTVGVRVSIDSYIEMEIDEYHTKDEAIEAAMVRAVDEVASRIEQDPSGFAELELYQEPEYGSVE